MPVLSFDVKFKWVPADPKKGGQDPGFWRTDVAPRVDGKLLHRAQKDVVFDTFEVLAAGGESGSVDLFNCSCGTPECVGIFECCELEAGESSIRWVFPGSPFRARLSRRIFHKGDPLELVFERGQYLDALKDLSIRIDAKKAEGRPVAFGPSEAPSEECLRLSVDGYLKLWEGRRVQRELWLLDSERAAGALREWELVAMLPDGSKFVASLADIAWGMCKPGPEPIDREARNRRVELMRPGLLADPASVAAGMAPELAMSIFSCMAGPGGSYPDDDDSADSEEERGRLELLWSMARFKVVRRHPGLPGVAMRLPVA